MSIIGKKFVNSAANQILPPVFTDSISINRHDDQRFLLQIKSFIKERFRRDSAAASLFITPDTLQKALNQGEDYSDMVDSGLSPDHTGTNVLFSQNETIRRISSNLRVATIICTSKEANELVKNQIINRLGPSANMPTIQAIALAASGNTTSEIFYPTSVGTYEGNGIIASFEAIPEAFAPGLESKLTERDEGGQYYRIPIDFNSEKKFLNNQKYISVYQFIMIHHDIDINGDLGGFKIEDLELLNQLRGKIEHTVIFEDGKINPSSEIVVDRNGSSHLGPFVRARVSYLNSEFLKGASFLGDTDENGNNNYTEDDMLFIRKIPNSKVQDHRFFRRGAQQEFMGRRNFGIGTEYPSISAEGRDRTRITGTRRRRRRHRDEILTFDIKEDVDPYTDFTPYTDPRYQSLIKPFPNFRETARQMKKQLDFKKSKFPNIGLIANHDKVNGKVSLHITIDQQQIMKNFSRLGHLWDKLPKFAHFSLLYPKRNLRLLSVKILRRRVHDEAYRANDFNLPVRTNFDDKVDLVCHGGERGNASRGRGVSRGLVDSSWSEMNDNSTYGTLVETFDLPEEQFKNTYRNEIRDIDFPERIDQIYKSWVYSGTGLIHEPNPAKSYAKPDDDENDLPINGLGLPCFPFYRVLVGKDESFQEITDGVYQYGIEMTYLDPMAEFFQILHTMVVDGRKIVEQYYQQSLIPAGGGKEFFAGPRASAIDEETRRVTSPEHGSFNHITGKFTISFIGFVKRNYDSFIVPALNYAVVSNVLFANEEFKTQMQDFDQEYINYQANAMAFKGHEGANHVSNTFDKITSLLNPNNTTPEQIGEILNSFLSLERAIEELVDDNIIKDETTVEFEKKGNKSKKVSLIEIEKWFTDEDNYIIASETKETVGSYFGSEGGGLVTNFPAISGDQMRERIQDEIRKFGIPISPSDDQLSGLGFSTPATLTYETVRVVLPGISADSAKHNRFAPSITEQTLGVDLETLAKITTDSRDRDFAKTKAYLEFKGIDTFEMTEARNIPSRTERRGQSRRERSSTRRKFVRAISKQTTQILKNRKEKGEATFNEIYDATTLEQQEYASTDTGTSDIITRKADINTLSDLFCSEKEENTFDKERLVHRLFRSIKGSYRPRNPVTDSGHRIDRRQYYKLSIDRLPIQIRIFLQFAAEQGLRRGGQANRIFFDVLESATLKQDLNALKPLHNNSTTFKCINPVIFGNIGVIKRFVGFQDVGPSGKKHTSQPIFRTVMLNQALRGLTKGLYKIEKYVNPSLGIVQTHNVPSKEFYFEITEDPIPMEEKLIRGRIADLLRYKSRSFSVVDAATNGQESPQALPFERGYNDLEPVETVKIWSTDDNYEGELFTQDIERPKIRIGRRSSGRGGRASQFLESDFIDLGSAFRDNPSFGLLSAQKGLLTTEQMQGLLALAKARNVIIEGSDRNATIEMAAMKAQTSLRQYHHSHMGEDFAVNEHTFVPLQSYGILVYDTPLHGDVSLRGPKERDLRTSGIPYYGPYVIHPSHGFINVKSYVSYFDSEGWDGTRVDVRGRISSGYQGDDRKLYKLKFWDPQKDEEKLGKLVRNYGQEFSRNCTA